MKARIVYIFFVLLSLPGVASAQVKPEKEKIRIGYAARVVAHSIPYLTAQAGLFREEGVQVDVVQTAGSVALMALIAGEVDFSIMSAFLLIPSFDSKWRRHHAERIWALRHHDSDIPL